MAYVKELLERRSELISHPYWIAETAYNHEGDFDYFLQLMDALRSSGADAVKFHIMLDLDAYMVPEHTLYPTLKKWLFTKDQWRQLFRRCRQAGMEVIGLADELPSVEFLLEEQVDALAIHATSLNDHFMLKRLAVSKKPLFVGIGGATPDEINYALHMLASKQDLILMYGIQLYPTPPEFIDLQKIPLYQSQFGVPVGYADHMASTEVVNRYLAFATAYSLGGRIFEQHVTLDLSQKREDDEAALDVHGFRQLKQTLDVVVQMAGTVGGLNEGEKAYGKVRKHLVAAREIPPGIILQEQDIACRLTEGVGDTQPRDFPQIVGQRLKRKIGKGTAFCWKDLDR
ncbi:N-acetylneuraminate synthase family protein [Brevibacillus sp. NRS-1366]|uniref:N-acetylneuraminate synthase family protein n=1 Tax=Brevibacillus sp. NRS-1366 TaxID=3233899 RepID=UPI003D21F04D